MRRKALQRESPKYADEAQVNIKAEPTLLHHLPTNHTVYVNVIALAMTQRLS